MTRFPSILSAPAVGLGQVRSGMVHFLAAVYSKIRDGLTAVMEWEMSYKHSYSEEETA